MYMHHTENRCTEKARESKGQERNTKKEKKEKNKDDVR